MNGSLYADLSLLDARNVEDINNVALPDIALPKLTTYLLGFINVATMENLQSKLKNLVTHKGKLKYSNLEPYRTKTFSETS